MKHKRVLAFGLSALSILAGSSASAVYDIPSPNCEIVLGSDHNQTSSPIIFRPVEDLNRINIRVVIDGERVGEDIVSPLGTIQTVIDGRDVIMYSTSGINGVGAIIAFVISYAGSEYRRIDLQAVNLHNSDNDDANFNQLRDLIITALSPYFNHDFFQFLLTQNLNLTIAIDDGNITVTATPVGN